MFTSDLFDSVTDICDNQDIYHDKRDVIKILKNMNKNDNSF